MSTAVKILVGLAVAALVTVGSVFLFVTGTYNSFVSLEKGVVAQYKQNENNYDNMWKKFKESTQVADMYASDTEKVFKAAISGRYGEKGSQAVFQMLKEQNPKLDPSLYTKIQSMIESGRNSFEENQKILLDKKRIYEIQLATFPSMFIATTFGFPKIDLSKYDIITSDRTQGAFAVGKDEEIKLR